MELKYFFLTFFFLASQTAASIIGNIHYGITDGRKSCTVYARGRQKDDVPNIMKAFRVCGNHGYITFPKGQNYWIGQKLNLVLNDVKIEWKGQWTFSDDLDYWRNNSYMVEFQNHRAGFIITGKDIWIDGYGTGGIHGNGNKWYEDEAGKTREGRPMPFVFWNVTRVAVQNLSIIDPPLWGINIMNGTNMSFRNMYVNATAPNAPWGTNWVQNTDGFDTMDARNILLENFIFQGGDDCVAIKPRSYDITIRNVTCRGGNGIAIGSLGQYLEDSSVENVHIDNVRIIRYNEDMHNSAYIKTWVGYLANQTSYESGGQPRGGGWGVVRNVLFSNFYVEGADKGPALSQESGRDGRGSGTSKMLVSNVVWANFTGYTVGGGKAASLGCSAVNKCYNIVFDNVHLLNNATGEPAGESCVNVAPGGVRGLSSTQCNQ
ncbi:Exopolygalacturonase [Dactylella cylindrospora]|nr:Exopolygalacturonase [Dactylella cylindrospora]